VSPLLLLRGKGKTFIFGRGKNQSLSQQKKIIRFPLKSRRGLARGGERFSTRGFPHKSEK
jgi:hypothetical protein